MKSGKHSRRIPPLVIGTGLLALDVVIKAGSAEPSSQWSGGTCGNVLLALRYLGWRSAPVARFSKGHAASQILDDLRAWGVSTRYVTLTADGSTPVIVHRISRTASGEPYHTFSWRCPNCGTRLPGYKPILATAAQSVAKQLGSPRVFFFDRVSRGALTLARACAELGAAVIFEPSGVGNPLLFREAWRLAHIVKYSHERLHDLPDDLDDGTHGYLRIETLGREGLRYQSRLRDRANREWRRLDALPAVDTKDTAGSGDWCTAGIIHSLLKRGLAGLRLATKARLDEAMRYGQALAAWNCSFEGARGGMYSVEKREFERQVEMILRGTDRKRITDYFAGSTAGHPIAQVCPSCDYATPARRRQSRQSLRSGR